jgi:hypothetical protein
VNKTSLQVAPDYMIEYPTVGGLNDAMQRLVHCTEHGGSHHFVVYGDRRQILMSANAVKCLTGVTPANDRE